MRSKRRKELACPERGFEPSAPSGRCSEGRIGRNREYCKRQRSKTTIFQPAFVAASATSRRRGCIGAALVCVNPSVNPPCGVLPAPRPGSLLVRFTNSYIKPALKGEVAASATSRRRGCIGAALVCVNPSVNPPCGVLPAPRKGEPFGSPLTKSCPRWRGKWHGEAMTKGERLNQPKSPSYSPSVGSRRQLPRKRWSLFARFYLNFILAPP